MTLVDELIKSKKLRKKYLTTESQKLTELLIFFTHRGICDTMVTVFIIQSFFETALFFYTQIENDNE